MTNLKHELPGNWGAVKRENNDFGNKREHFCKKFALAETTRSFPSCEQAFLVASEIRVNERPRSRVP